MQLNLAGARKPDKTAYTLADLLPPHLAADFRPPPLSEEDVMARFRLAGFHYTETKK